jgi:hypothetical protein
VIEVKSGLIFSASFIEGFTALVKERRVNKILFPVKLLVKNLR